MPRGRPKKLHPGEKMLIFMRNGAGWTTPSGVNFTEDHPFQLVEVMEAQELLTFERFERGTVEALKSYYSIEE